MVPLKDQATWSKGKAKVMTEVQLLGQGTRIMAETIRQDLTLGDITPLGHTIKIIVEILHQDLGITDDTPHRSKDTTKETRHQDQVTKMIDKIGQKVVSTAKEESQDQTTRDQDTRGEKEANQDMETRKGSRCK